MTPDIGLTDKARKKVADALAQVLADSYALYLQTHGFHWNVEGPRFGVLHDLFGKQYAELWAALDELAERIRALGHFAPVGPEIYARTGIAPANGQMSEDAMLKTLLSGHEVVVKSARAGIEKAEECNDTATADLLTERVAASEKAAWMLRAHFPH